MPCLGSQSDLYLQVLTKWQASCYVSPPIVFLTPMLVYCRLGRVDLVVECSSESNTIREGANWAGIRGGMTIEDKRREDRSTRGQEDTRGQEGRTIG